MPDIRALVIRADASKDIGAGHVMRCLALAQQWQDQGGRCIFVMALDAGAIFERLKSENMEVRRINSDVGSRDDIAATVEIARQEDASWIVLDGYNFTVDNQKQIKDADFKLLVIDDNADYEHYYADIVLNQNIHATQEMYPEDCREDYTRLLLGVEYCLLRREFVKHKNIVREYGDKPQRIMITMGGADPDDVTCKVLDLFVQPEYNKLKLKVIVGANNPHFDKIVDKSKNLPCSCDIIHDADDKQMAETMLWADLAISSAGSTVWEMSCLKLPFVTLVLADNQREISRILNDKYGVQGISLPISSSSLLSIIKTAKNKSPQISVASKTRDIIRSFFWSRFSLREATLDDSRLLWDWVNNSEVRKNSFNQEKISWEDHCNWLQNKLCGESECIYIVENDLGEPAGQIRFDYKDDAKAEIDFSVAQEFRGHSLGVFLLINGVRLFLKAHPLVDIHGVVKASNISSIKSFCNAGFVKVGSRVVNSVPCEIFKYI